MAEKDYPRHHKAILRFLRLRDSGQGETVRKPFVKKDRPPITIFDFTQPATDVDIASEMQRQRERFLEKRDSGEFIPSAIWEAAKRNGWTV